MEDIVSVNWLAIVIAAVVKFAIGAGWYAPPVFGKKWQAVSGVEPDSAGMPRAMIVGIIGDLIMAYILARFIGHYATDGLVAGAVVGFMAWLGFVATVMLGGMMYENRKMSLFYINGGYQLVGLVVMGAIIGAM
ncbi:MAG: DUF1761 domain-containing protein [Alphaproteobacteria bacterium]